MPRCIQQAFTQLLEPDLKNLVNATQEAAIDGLLNIVIPGQVRLGSGEPVQTGPHSFVSVV